MKEKKELWYNSVDDGKVLDYLMDDHTKLYTRIMKNENERAEQEARNRIKLTKMENEVNELKFCVYALMFFITVVLLAMAFS
jgi:hypothetical protein